jgi:hypothetical protein
VRGSEPSHDREGVVYENSENALEAKLSVAEEAALKRIARDCKKKASSIRLELERLPLLRAQWHTAQEKPAAAKRDELWRKLIRTLQDGRLELKTALGEQRFEVLDTYVWSEMGNRVGFTGAPNYTGPQPRR